MTDRELIAAAVAARRNCHTPYSHYRVGAAILAGEGRTLYTGCNIENASYPATVCAERTAIFKAVSEGDREIHCVAVVAGPEGQEPPFDRAAAPCGVCRQVLAEFAAEDCRILLAHSETDYDVCTPQELLPRSFTSKDLG